MTITDQGSSIPQQEIPTAELKSHLQQDQK